MDGHSLLGLRRAQAVRINTHFLVPLAAVAEMCDRTYYGVWNADLDSVLHTP